MVKVLSVIPDEKGKKYHIDIDEDGKRSSYTVSAEAYAEIGSPVSDLWLDEYALSVVRYSHECYLALKRAYYYLGARDRSRLELKNKLTEVGYSSDAAEYAVVRLTELGYIDEEGYLIITGRKKNIIVTANGKNIFPEELETYLMRSKFIAECVVVGYMNEKKKDYDIVALVYPDYAYAKEALGIDVDDGSMQTSAIIYDEVLKDVEEVNSIVQTYKRIDMTILRVEEFPKNSSRKIKRVGIADLCREEYLAKRG